VLNARTIVEDDGVSIVLAAAREKYPRFDEVWEGWTWRLVRDPLIHAVPVPGSNPQAYVVKSPDVAHYGGLPAAVVILFTLPDANTIRVIAVNVY
jgi:hypothetical protein